MADWWQERTEDLIIFFLIGAILLELLGWLPAEIEYIEKIVSWTALGYALYKTSLSDIFIGRRHRHVDVILIISYFLLILKTFVQYSMESVHHSEFMASFFDMIIRNAAALEMWGFIAGSIGIAAVSFYITFFLEINGPSILEAVHGPGRHGGLSMKAAVKFMINFLLMVGFFIVVFNLLTEWFLFALDKPIIIFALFIYLFRLHSYSRRLHPEHAFFRMGTTLERTYERFIELFHRRRTFMLGISGMLVLHLLTDMSSFIIPYVTSIGETIYTSSLGPGHDTLGSLLLQDYGQSDGLWIRFLLLYGYAMNTLAMLILMAFPAFIWYVIYSSGKDKSFKVTWPVISSFFSSVAYFVLLPAYTITQIGAPNIYGVDIGTSSILSSAGSLALLFQITAAIFIVVAFLCLIDVARAILIIVMTVISLVFFGYYIYSYFMSLSTLYVMQLSALLASGSIFIFSIFLAMYIISMLFYCGGYLAFVIKTFSAEH